MHRLKLHTRVAMNWLSITAWLSSQNPFSNSVLGVLQFEIRAGDQPLLRENGEGVVAPAPLLRWLVDLPEILKVKQGQGAPVCADPLQRSPRDHFLLCCGLEGLPGFGEPPHMQRFEQGQIFGQEKAQDLRVFGQHHSCDFSLATRASK
jgi:hypothetical protein